MASPMIRLAPGSPPELELSTEGSQLRIRATANAYVDAIAIEFHFPNIRALSHSGFVRMIGKPTISPDEDWRKLPHSPLAADFHMQMPFGTPSFGLYPPMVVVWTGDDGETVATLIGPTEEFRRRASWDWRATSDGWIVECRLLPWGLDGEFLTPDSRVEAVFCAPTVWPLSPETYLAYNDALAILNRRPTEELFWGSWNDGIFRDIDQTRLTATAEVLRERAPNVRWIQIDDGWAGPSDAVPGTDDGISMSDFGTLDSPIYTQNDPRFPNGMRGLADAIRATGLRPAIWLTPTVFESSPLFRQRPEWFIPDATLHFWKEMRFLDFSLDEVRTYVLERLWIVFEDWGFEGCKLDFWSMAFDQDDIRPRNQDHPPMESLYWLTQTIRDFVGEDGLFLHCIDLPFGSPFRARTFDRFRYYSDSEGICANPDMMREQMLWAAYLVGLYGVQRFWFPDGDGLGRFRHFDMPDSHFRLWCSFLLGSGTLVELAGWMHDVDDPRQETQLKCAENAMLGCPVELPGYSFGSEPPVHWVRHDPDGSRLVAWANHTDRPIPVSVPTGVEWIIGEPTETIAPMDGIAYRIGN